MDACQRCKDLEQICWNLLEKERERDKPHPPGWDPFAAALDGLEHYLTFGRKAQADPGADVEAEADEEA